MAELTEDLFFSTITEWNARLKSKQISAVELARAFSARLEKLGPRYNALALPLSERALKKAKDVDGDIKRDHLRSPLMGIPFGAKDLLSLAGVPTTWGAKPYAAQVFDYDSTVLKKLDKRLADPTCVESSDLTTTNPATTPANASLAFSPTTDRG